MNRQLELNFYLKTEIDKDVFSFVDSHYENEGNILLRLIARNLVFDEEDSRWQYTFTEFVGLPFALSDMNFNYLFKYMRSRATQRIKMLINELRSGMDNKKRFVHNIMGDFFITKDKYKKAVKFSNLLLQDIKNHSFHLIKYSDLDFKIENNVALVNFKIKTLFYDKEEVGSTTLNWNKDIHGAKTDLIRLIVALHKRNYFYPASLDVVMKRCSYFFNIDLSQHENLASRGISSTNPDTLLIFEKLQNTIEKMVEEKEEKRRKKEEQRLKREQRRKK